MDDQEFVNLQCPVYTLMMVDGDHEPSLSLWLDCPLQPRRLWTCILVVGRCATEKVSEAKEISYCNNIIMMS